MGCNCYSNCCRPWCILFEKWLHPSSEFYYLFLIAESSLCIYYARLMKCLSFSCICLYTHLRTDYTRAIIAVVVTSNFISAVLSCKCQRWHVILHNILKTVNWFLIILLTKFLKMYLVCFHVWETMYVTQYIFSPLSNKISLSDKNYILRSLQLANKIAWIGHVVLRLYNGENRRFLCTRSLSPACATSEHHR